MCTSVALGFYIRDYEDFNSFKQQIMCLANLENSIISVYEQKPEAMQINISYGDKEVKIRSSTNFEESPD